MYTCDRKWYRSSHSLKYRIASIMELEKSSVSFDSTLVECLYEFLCVTTIFGYRNLSVRTAHDSVDLNDKSFFCIAYYHVFNYSKSLQFSKHKMHFEFLHTNTYFLIDSIRPKSRINIIFYVMNSIWCY